MLQMASYDSIAMIKMKNLLLGGATWCSAMTVTLGSRCYRLASSPVLSPTTLCNPEEKLLNFSNLDVIDNFAIKSKNKTGL